MNKKNLILGGILIVLVGLAYVYDGPFQDWQAERSRPESFFVDLSFDDLSAIAIAKGGESVELLKEGDRWKVGGAKGFYLTDSDLAGLRQAIDGISSAELELVSDSPERQGEFQATSESGALVALKQGDAVLQEFILGKPGNDFNSSYVTAEGRSETYLIRRSLDALNRTDWYDRAVFSLDSETISKVRFQYGRTEFTVEKGEDGWAGSAPRRFTVSEDKISPIVSLLSRLSAVDVPAQDFAGTGLEKNQMIIEFGGGDASHVLMVGDAQDPAAEDKLYYAKRGDSDNIYLISASDRDRLQTTIAGLR